MPQKRNSKAKKSGTCHVCGDTGHYARDCEERKSGSEELMLQDTTRKCHVCGETGHYARECKDKKSDTVKVLLPDTTGKSNMCGETGHYARECEDKKSDTAKVVLKAVLGLGTQSNKKDEGWYLNCGSSEHVCYSRDMFVDYNPMRDHEVILSNDDHIDVAGIGTVVIRFDTGKVLTLSNVLHIPEISQCYVSVAKLDDLGYITCFGNGLGVITKSDEVIAKGYYPIAMNAVCRLHLMGERPDWKVIANEHSGADNANDSVLITTFGGGQCVIQKGDVIIQKGYKGDMLYMMDVFKEPPTFTKLEIHAASIDLLVGDEHPELTKARARGWYLLPRCAMHVCNSREMFVDYQPVTGYEVVLGDDSRVALVGYGTVKLQLTTGKVLTLEKVFHMPEVVKCCISVKILKRMGFRLEFDDEGCCYVKKKKGGQIVGNGFVDNGLWCLGVTDERSGGNQASAWLFKL